MQKNCSKDVLRCGGWATSWQRFKDLNITELNKLRDDLIDFYNRKGYLSPKQVKMYQAVISAKHHIEADN